MSSVIINHFFFFFKVYTKTHWIYTQTTQESRRPGHWLLYWYLYKLKKTCFDMIPYFLASIDGKNKTYDLWRKCFFFLFPIILRWVVNIPTLFGRLNLFIVHVLSLSFSQDIIQRKDLVVQILLSFFFFHF